MPPGSRKLNFIKKKSVSLLHDYPRLALDCHGIDSQGKLTLKAVYVKPSRALARRVHIYLPQQERPAFPIPMNCPDSPREMRNAFLQYVSSIVASAAMTVQI